MQWCLGVEIGGSKLQIGLGHGREARFERHWRTAVDASRGAEVIRQQLLAGILDLLDAAGLQRSQIAGVGVGFGGPVDTLRGVTVISHQVDGWEQFPLVEWFQVNLGLKAVLHNDADTAAFAEASFGAGVGFDPLLYVTVGSGIGGGLVLMGRIYRGQGAGACEIGHLRPRWPAACLPVAYTVEQMASGFGIEERARRAIEEYRELTSHPTEQAGPDAIVAGFHLPADAMAAPFARVLSLVEGRPERVSTRVIAQAAAMGDPFAQRLLADAADCIGWALSQTTTLLNPARIVVGGGVSLIGADLFMDPVRAAARRYAFRPFSELAEIVPAGLGEEVVLYGAVALARAEFTSQPALRLVSDESVD
jgi:glucokinase